MIANILTIVAVIAALFIGRYFGKREVWKEIGKEWVIVEVSKNGEPQSVQASRERLETKDILNAEYLEVKK